MVHILKGLDSEEIKLYHSGKEFYLMELFGLQCGNCRRPPGSSLFGGLINLDTGHGNIDTDFIAVRDFSYNDGEIYVAWTIENSLLLESRWSICEETGVLHRKDSIKNEGSDKVELYSAGARFVFSPGRYEVYSQASSWNNENQGLWQRLHHGSIRLGNEGGRTTQGGTPFMVLRDCFTQRAVAFQLIPEGNWNISATAMTGPGDSLPYAVVEAGMAEKHLSLSLAPGETFKLPELLIYNAIAEQEMGSVPSYDFNAWKLHTYYLKNIYHMKFVDAPIVYNTWFDVFEFLDVPRLRKQVQVAKKLGCEIFVIDAGWYGASEGDWSSQTGDWREKPHASFYGKMSEFADEVRAQGMGFGLWLEPERIGPSTPIRKQHPEWFILGGNGCYYPDLNNPVVYEYIYDVICGMIEKYKLAWMKIDYNFDLGIDKSGSELNNYYKAWYSILDSIMDKYPDFFLEGCASGGMRLDLNTLNHFDVHFLSDNVNPWDVLSIYQGALLRLPPGLVNKWAVMRSTGGGIVKYGLDLSQAPKGVITPEGATWDRVTSVNPDFPLKAAMNGILGISGDFSELNEEQFNKVAASIRFYKQWRGFIRSSRAFLLNKPLAKGDRSGWVGIQLQDLQGDKNLVFIYRLEDSSNKRNFYLKGLRSHERYNISLVDADYNTKIIFEGILGDDLMRNGFLAEINERNNGAIYIVDTE